MFLEWDNTTMPMINNDLMITKNEISLQVFMTKNSGRAGKVLEGHSTDMEDMMKLCNHYHIDICQFMRLPDGSHPIMLHRDEYRRLRKAVMGDDETMTEYEVIEEKRPESNADGTKEQPEEATTDDIPTLPRYVDDKNVSVLLEQMSKQAEKIDELYGRIIDLTEDNARMRVLLAKPYEMGQQRGGMIADDSETHSQR